MKLTWILVGVLVLVLLALIFAFPKTSSAAAPLQEAFVQATQAPSLLPPSKQPVSIGPTNVLELQNGDEADGFLSQGPAILMVYATWCGHCKNMMPAFDQVSTQTNVKFARIEGHKAPQFMQKHGIRGFPTLLTVTRTNELGRHMGGRDIGSLMSAANALATAVAVVPAIADNAVVTPPVPVVASDGADAAPSVADVLPGVAAPS
jgi:thiol-disulfide isomerase/thioredoxin